MPLNNSRDGTHCPHSTARDQGPLQQSYLRRAVLPEATIVNNSRSSKTKGIRKTRKLRVVIALGAANHMKTKLLGLSQTTTTTMGTTGMR